VTDKVQPSVLITGSSRGIGLGAAIAFARTGFAVAINGPADDEELKTACELVAKAGQPVVAVAGDVTDLSQHQTLLDEAEKVVGPLSTLINNAGVSALNRGDLLEVTEESYDRCQNVNAKAQFFLSQCWAKRLLSRQRNDGRFYSLINVSSSNAVAASENRGEYCASKATSAMISKLFATRLGRENISVYDIQPGIIETAMTKPALEQYQRRIAEDALTLLPRVGDTAEVGQCMVSLASGSMPYTTGQVISVDAGLLVPRF